MFDFINEDNILVISSRATEAQFNSAVKSLTSSYEVESNVVDGEISIDINFLTEDQKQTLRDYYGYDAVFSDKSGEPGDIDITLTLRVELMKRKITISGYSFLTQDRHTDGDFEWGIIHPTVDQIHSFFLPALLMAV